MTHEWIPPAVMAVAGRLKMGKSIGEKLLTLESVWKQLERRAEELDDSGELFKRLAGLPYQWRLEAWGTLTTIAVSLLGSKRVSKETVRNWCEGCQ